MKNKVVYLQGGLGNQLFQYSFGLYLKEKTNSAVIYSASFLDVYFPGKTPRKFDLHFLKNVANFIQSFAPKKYLQFYFFYLLHKLKILHFFQIEWETTSSYENQSFFKSNHFIGYWQNLDYILPVKKTLIHNLKSQFQLTIDAKKIFDQIQISENSVSIHVRRGDFLTNKQSAQIYYHCGIEYYQRAYTKLCSNQKQVVAFIFSDDLDWCRQNFDFIQNKVFVDLKNSHPMNEIILMSDCKYNIIANSTFSWWGAILNNHSNQIVYCPQNWFRNSDAQNLLIPNSWHIVEN